MLQVVCLFDKGSRFPLMIAEGLLNHPKVDVCFNNSVRALGKVLATATLSEPLADALFKCDLIFVSDLEHFAERKWLQFIGVNNLWPKVVVYDFKDSPEVDLQVLNQSLAYFKRSYCSGPERKSLVDQGKQIFPLNYCLLDSYLDIPAQRNGKKSIDIGYFFDPAIVEGDKRRGNVLRCLTEEDWSSFSTMIGITTTSAVQGRRSVFYDPEGNAWVDYMTLLQRTKVVFSAFPSHWDGDSRMWEAMASQALCFLDKSYIPTEHYFQHGRHCFFFDAGNTASIRGAIKLAKEYLNPEKVEERKRIAQEGYSHAINFHRSINRVDFILRTIGAL